MSTAAARRSKAKIASKSPKTPGKVIPITAEPEEKGLWVNTNFLRSLSSRPPQRVLHPVSGEQRDYYLHLADVALGQKERRKSDRRAAAFKEARAKAKKRKRA